MPFNGILPRVALWGLSLSFIYKHAPGEPAWMTTVPSPPAANDNDAYSWERFTGGDGSTVLTGRLYKPTWSNPIDDDGESRPVSLPPVVVLAQGLGLTQESGTQPFVHSLTGAGFSVLTFDYATFGLSGGWPRHQVIPDSHVADLRAALSHMRKHRHVDGTRIGLVGLSLGGGHVLTVAADQDKDIFAVVAIVPHVKSGLESLVGSILRDPINSILGLLQVTGALAKWCLSQALLKQTTYIPLHGPPASSAMMQNPGDDEGYGSLIDPKAREFGWKNLASVGSVLPILFYRPFDTVNRIRCPTLVIVAEQDTLCPAAAAKEAANVIRSNQNSTKLVEMDLGHFDIYNEKPLKATLHEAVIFLQAHLM